MKLVQKQSLSLAALTAVLRRPILSKVSYAVSRRESLTGSQQRLVKVTRKAQLRRLPVGQQVHLTGRVDSRQRLRECSYRANGHLAITWIPENCLKEQSENQRLYQGLEQAIYQALTGV
jgi:hypothetical protein